MQDRKIAVTDDSLLFLILTAFDTKDEFACGVLYSWMLAIVRHHCMEGKSPFLCIGSTIDHSVSIYIHRSPDMC